MEGVRCLGGPAIGSSNAGALITLRPFLAAVVGPAPHTGQHILGALKPFSRVASITPSAWVRRCRNLIASRHAHVPIPEGDRSPHYAGFTMLWGCCVLLAFQSGNLSQFWLQQKPVLPQIAKYRDSPIGKCPDGDLLPFLAHVIVRNEPQVLRTGPNTLAGFYCSSRPGLIQY